MTNDTFTIIYYSVNINVKIAKQKSDNFVNPQSAQNTRNYFMILATVQINF